MPLLNLSADGLNEIQWQSWSQFGLASLLVGWLIIRWIPKLIDDFRTELAAQRKANDDALSKLTEAQEKAIEKLTAAHDAAIKDITAQFRDALREIRATNGGPRSQ